MSKLFLAAVAAALTLGTAAGAGAAPSSWTALQPGAPADLDEAVPVNVVFVGYEAAQVPWAQVQAELPAASEPVVRSRLWYGKKEKLGISYSYAYSPVYAPATFENAFFAHLSGLATPESQVDGLPRTLFQQQYNDQAANVLDVGRTTSSTARRSSGGWPRTSGRSGSRPTTNTVVFVNWYGRPDFKFHTYTKMDEPDPDTGYNFGELRQTRKLIAWGGTAADDEENGFGVASRLWFHDLSAGPESWTDNWNVTDADVDGDGSADYRMPPIWEYTAGGYRSPTALAGDLGKITRYVATNLLFTTSPLYPPYTNADRIADTVNLDANTIEGWNKVNASTQYRDPAVLLEETRDLLPKTYSLDETDVAFKGDVKNCYLQWVAGVRCYNDRVNYSAGANLFLNAALSLGVYRDGNAEYESMLLSYATDQASKAAGPLGFADDNWIDGTPSGVFSFVDPAIVAAGYGLTTTEIHEHGHHTSMSHPHDGWDSGTQTDYGPEGAHLLRVVGRRVQLDDELHRPELGLQPVRQGQHRPPPRGRLLHGREPDRGGRPRQPERGRRDGVTRRRGHEPRRSTGGDGGARLRGDLRQRTAGLPARTGGRGHGGRLREPSRARPLHASARAEAWRRARHEGRSALLVRPRCEGERQAAGSPVARARLFRRGGGCPAPSASSQTCLGSRAHDGAHRGPRDPIPPRSRTRNDGTGLNRSSYLTEELGIVTLPAARIAWPGRPAARPVRTGGGGVQRREEFLPKLNSPGPRRPVRSIGTVTTLVLALLAVAALAPAAGAKNGTPRADATRIAVERTSARTQLHSV